MPPDVPCVEALVVQQYWQSKYSRHISTVEQAIRRIPPGRRIFIGSGAAEPAQLVEGLVEHGDHLADNEIVHLLTLGPAPYVRPEMASRFRHTAFFIGPNVRDAVQAGRADFMPIFLSEIPALIRRGRVPIDVALVQVSPPDSHGFVSLGVSVDIVRAAVDTAKILIAEVNPNMPRSLGDSFVHVSRFAALVPVDTPLLELESPEPDEVTRMIAHHVATLIPDGATLQAGIGKIPNAVLQALKHHNDMGVHTEMFSDGIVELVELGVINGRRKTMLPGKIVTSFVMGTRRLYDWIHDNPLVEMRESAFTNDPMTIARHDRMIAINSALGVDLSGQVAADTLLGRFFSGIGGQVDFIRGAARSRDGRPIIALPSTNKRGDISRIAASFEEGAGVVTSRGDVRYVVTEHGVADLWGRNIRQRAMSLIEIAHPDHRADLVNAAKKRRFVFADQIAPPAKKYRFDLQQDIELPTGEMIRLRPARVIDEENLQSLFYKLSRGTIYRRFMGVKTVMHHAEVQRMVDVDYHQNLALVVMALEEGAETEMVAMGQYNLVPKLDVGELAFMVLDSWQHKGLGTMLCHRLVELARSFGLKGVSADVLAFNTGMIKVFESHPDGFRRNLYGGVLRFQLDFEPIEKPDSEPEART